MESTMENYETLYKEVCRICLSLANDQMVPLIEENYELTSYGKDIENITQISIENVKAPPQMCQQCLTLLNETKHFINKCKLSQAYFENIKNCSEFYRKKIVVDTILCNGFKDNTELEPMKIDKKVKIEFEIPLLEVKETIKNCYHPVNNELQLNQLKLIKPTAKINNKSQNEILKFLKNNSSIKIKHIFKKPTSKVNNTKIFKIKKELNDVKPINKFSKPKDDLEKFKNLDGRFVCDLCQATFKKRNSLVVHLNRHMAPMHNCEHCAKAFPTKAGLRFHLSTRHDIGEHLKCSDCDFKTIARCELERHKTVHTGERPYICEQCGRDFRTRYVLRQHLLVHSEKSVQCPKCPLKFRNRSQLSTHDNSRHARRYMYGCPSCERLFARNKSVRKHLVHVHHVPRCEQGKVPLIRVKETDESEPTTPAPLCQIEESKPGC